MITCNGGRPAALRAVCVAGAATLALTGCACLEEDWNTYVMFEAEAAGNEAEELCSEDPLKNRSNISAELYKSADPALLMAARREADAPCESQGARGSAKGSWTATLK